MLSFSRTGIVAFAVGAAALAGCEQVAPADSSSAALSRGNADGLALCPAETPDAVAAPENQRLELGLSASGVQIYTCSPGSDGKLAWSFTAPEATLFFGPFQVGKHFAGPSWQLLDGSKVVTTKIAAATVDPKAIPWLLTQTAWTSGDGLLSDVTYVQRLSTDGGLAPTSGCAVAADAGKQARVPYSADYFFYVPSPLPHHNRGCR
jgi:hypothetical protein